MRLLSIYECAPGDRVADTIRRPDGRPILRSGTVLTETILQQLDQWNVNVIPVEWEGMADIEPDSWMSEGLLASLIQWLNDQEKSLTDTGARQARVLAKQVIDEMPIGNRQAFEFLLPYQGGNRAQVAWINIVILVVKLSQQLAPDWVEAYAMAAMLLGLSFPGISQGELVWPDPDHHRVVVETAKVIGGFPSPTIATLSQHHAHWDGSGVPPLKGPAIYRGATVLGLAETLACLMYRTDETPLPGHEALEWIVGGAGSDFPLEVVQRLQRIFAPYPTGQVVLCNGRDPAAVISAKPGFPGRPKIRLLTGSEAGKELDLADPGQQSVVITGLYEQRDWPKNNGGAT